MRTQEEAEALGFVGSPTIRVDGRDVDEEGAARSRPSLTCRVYTDGRRRLARPEPRPARARALPAGAAR